MKDDTAVKKYLTSIHLSSSLFAGGRNRVFRLVLISIISELLNAKFAILLFALCIPTIESSWRIIIRTYVLSTYIRLYQRQLNQVLSVTLQGFIFWIISVVVTKKKILDLFPSNMSWASVFVSVISKNSRNFDGRHTHTHLQMHTHVHFTCTLYFALLNRPQQNKWNQKRKYLNL